MYENIIRIRLTVILSEISYNNYQIILANTEVFEEYLPALILQTINKKGYGHTFLRREDIQISDAELKKILLNDENFWKEVDLINNQKNIEEYGYSELKDWLLITKSSNPILKGN